MRDDDAEAPTLAHPATPTVVERPSQPAIAEAKAGSVVGRYKLVERLGAGAMGVVWSAQDPQLDRRIAIKLVHPNLARSAEASERLLREARAMAKLSHRAVVTVHDAGEATGQLFLAMELVEGTTLGAMLRRRDDRDWSRWFAMTLEAGRGLAAAHRADVMHRDFKPDNVLVDRAGRVCVADFGIATLGDAGVAAAATARWQADTPLDLTTTGALMGTPTYMSPQQLRGEPVDARADQFAFCVAMHEAIYGVRPFVVEERGLDMLPALVSAIEAQVLPEPPAGSSVPAGVREVLRRGLAADPEARWPDMDALLDALAAAATVAASVVALPEPPKRRRWWIVAGAAAVAAAVVLVIAVTGRPHAAAVPKRMFEVTLHTKLALAPDGNTIAVGRRMLEVRSLDDQDVHSVMVPGDSDVNMLELDDHELRFAVHGSANLRTWRYRDPAATLELGPQQSGGEWLGRTVFGELVELADGVIAIVDGAREIRRWNLGRRTPEVLAISPDGRRAAYLETERFSGAIVLLDLAGGVIARVERLDEPSALAWRDDHRLVYAIGTNEQPRIRQVEVTATGFGPPEELHRATTGWFAVVVARPDRLVFMDLHPSTRARILERTATPTVIEYDRATVGAALGWLGADEFVAWNRRTRMIELHGTHGQRATGTKLDREPVNATFADRELIVTVRRPGGRAVVAVSLDGDRELWRHERGTHAVRCAGDRKLPCFAIRSEAGSDRVVEIDPATGRFGTKVLAEGKLEDIAVRDDGERLLVVGIKTQIVEIDRDGTPVREIPVELTPTRSVAYDPSGGVLSSGTRKGDTYEISRYDGTTTAPLVTSVDDILSLVRPSPDGKRVLVLARAFAPDLWQLDLP